MLRLLRHCLLAAPLLALTVPLAAADPPGNPKDPRVVDRTLPDLTDFRTVDNAVTTRVSRAAPQDVQPGYLGVHVEVGAKGQLSVTSVEDESPAAAAGLQVGDIVQALGGQAISSADGLRAAVQGRAAGEVLRFDVLRGGKAVHLSATLVATSRPLSLTSQRAVLGIQTLEAADGVRVERVTPGMPAAEAGLKAGDLLVRANGTSLAGGDDKLRNFLSDKKPGDEVTLLVKREGKELERKVKLAADASASDPRNLQWDSRAMTLHRKEVYRLAVVPIDYPDLKRNPQITGDDWHKALFSRNQFLGKNATGQQVFGSLNDYYLEQSCGAFRVEGKVFHPVLVAKKRADYGNDQAGMRNPLLSEVLDKLHVRDGADAIKDFDGVFFLYSGDRYTTNRGGIYWPHRSMLQYKGRRLAYFICPEGGPRMASISVIAHEFGHMLGLPDLYARPESPGSEGLGIWCTMAVGHGRDGKPLHFSAWCKEQMGWLKPTMIDPTVKQKLVLAPIENSTKECFKVVVRPDGSEYFLLENRTARGYDRDLPAEGLLVWRVVDGRPVLEESHGIAGPPGPDRYLQSVPFPSKSNNAFTPYTTPSSRSQKGGGLPVHLTNIRRLADGRVTFLIGYEYL